MSSNHSITESPGLPSLKQLHPPRLARWTAWLMLLLFLGGPVGLMFVPWQQNLSASGRVVAFDPTERQQEIEAPIDGRILDWHVRENQPVKAGQKLVSIQDPDPDLPKRLGEERTSIVERQTAAKARIASFYGQISALRQSKERALTAADKRLKAALEIAEGAKRSVKVAMLNREIANINFGMEEMMQKEGLTSQLIFLTARQRRLATMEEEERAKNAEAKARLDTEAIREDIEKIRNDADASINSATASKQSAEAELASAARDLAGIEVRISRQKSQEVVAPCDGTVFRILANSSAGGSLVKAGDRLLVFTPRIKDAKGRMVELMVDGNDAPQLTTLWQQRGGNSIKVRIQFEGWPAVQWVGWPSLAVGTFGGQVAFVDPHDDGKGKFRVFVEPDPDEEPWPDDFSLRQGVRAQGWLLLDRVSLGYELWRRFNGFPAVMADKEDKAKPAKVKVPK